MKRLQTVKARARRVSLEKKAIMITSDGNQLDIVVTDISLGGLRLRADETFYDGENIVVGEEGVIRVERRNDLMAEIVWVQGCEAGGVFLEPAGLPENEKAPA